jgi:Fe2+ transport system protein B
MSNTDNITDNMTMYDRFNMNNCHVAQMISESNRLVLHVMFVQIFVALMTGTSIFSYDMLVILLATALSILLYHLLFRKFVEPKLEKMKLICLDNPTNIKDKLNNN